MTREKLEEEIFDLEMEIDFITFFDGLTEEAIEKWKKLDELRDMLESLQVFFISKMKIVSERM